MIKWYKIYKVLRMQQALNIWQFNDNALKREKKDASNWPSLALLSVSYIKRKQTYTQDEQV